MKSMMVKMMVAASLMLAGSASATEMPALAKKHSCVACHTIDKRKVGPAWADVAKMYKGQDAEAKLIAKVAKGGPGVWGTMPMPPNSPTVSDADIKELVKFILAL
ncbi:MAG: c-type cytochrome [Sideroxydans sp.]|nr:c-type cytochrome [Sideroxydans sp.]